MPLHDLFNRHPEAVGETYAEHMAAASGFGFKMILAGMACVVHGLLPFLFTRTGSDAIHELHARMVTNRRRIADPGALPARAD